MAAGITRIHGSAIPGSFQGGYQPRFFKIVDSATNYATGAGAVVAANAIAYTEPSSVFELAVRGVETVATVVTLGIPAAAGFIVAVDGGDFYGRDDHTGYAADTSAAALTAAIVAATSAAATVTVTEVTLTGIAFA